MNSEKYLILNMLTVLQARTLITSMLLNMRSRETNLHAAMNSLLLWSGSVSKQITQTLNHYGFCTSPRYQAAAVRSISRDAIFLAIKVANDPRHLILLPNDNFNWVGKGDIFKLVSQ
jgi:hypothetical protein